MAVSQLSGESWWDYLARKWAVMTGQSYDYGEMFGPEMPDDQFFEDQVIAQKRMNMALLALAAGLALLFFMPGKGRKRAKA